MFGSSSRPIPFDPHGRRHRRRGTLPRPEGFKPVRTTVPVMERAAGPVLGMRVLRVR